MKAKVTTLKGFKIQQTADNVFNVYTADEWSYGAGLRQVEWESGTLQEAHEFINGYNNPVESGEVLKLTGQPLTPDLCELHNQAEKEVHEEMNKYCLEFMKSAVDGVTTADEETKAKFIISLINCHDNGYYLVFSKGEWKLSNKKIETLQRQIEMRGAMVESLFQVMK